MADNAEVLLKAMKKAGKPLKAGEAAKAAGLPEKEVAKLIKALLADGTIVSPKRCYYAPSGR